MAALVGNSKDVFDQKMPIWFSSFEVFDALRVCELPWWP
jgi:hypothetical protein